MTDEKKSNKAEKSAAASEATTTVANTGKDGGISPEISGIEALYEHKILPRETALMKGRNVRIAIFIICVCYCSFLYYLVYGFTSDEAFRMLRGQLDAQLPTVKQETVDSMKQGAPKVVHEYSEQLVNSIPDVRMRLQEELLRMSSEQIDSLQQGLDQVFVDLIKESKTELDKMDSKLSTAEKMERLNKKMQLEMFQQSREVVDGIAKEYTSKMHELNSELHALQVKTNLTPKEKHQKEMLRVWSKLMSIQLKGVSKDFQKATEELGKDGATAVPQQ